MTTTTTTTEKKADIIIDGKRVSYTPIHVDISKLKYYPENPRVYTLLGKYDNATQADIERELWNLESTKDLHFDIKNNGGLVDPILVKDGMVLEGNSRLCAYRKLYENAKTAEERAKWTFIPSFVLDSSVTEKQVFQLLGTYHIRGKSQWRTFEQAGYVYRMKNQFGYSEKEIAEKVGLTETDVKQMIDTYVTMVKEEVNDPSKYSYFLEFYKNRELKKIVDKDPTFVKTFSTWVKEGKIPKAQDVRDLPKIIKEKKAKKQFVSTDGDFDSAKHIAVVRNPEHEDPFLKLLKRTTGELEGVEIPKLREDMKEPSRKHIVLRFIKEVDKFKRNLKLDG